MSESELAWIRSDPAQTSGPIPWRALFRHRQTWAFALGMFLTAPVWWFYLFWVPSFLHQQHGLELLELGPPLVVIYLMTDVGSIGGGWLSARSGYNRDDSGSATCGLGWRRKGPSETMKPKRRGHPWIAATLASGAVVALFFLPLLARNPLAGFDWFMSGTYYEWARTAFTEYGTLPLYMAGAPHSFNLIANPQSPVLSPLIWLLCFLPTGTYFKVLLVTYATLGLIGMVALLREHGVAPGSPPSPAWCSRSTGSSSHTSPSDTRSCWVRTCCRRCCFSSSGRSWATRPRSGERPG